MKGIRESDRDALERRFGLSKRLSARLVVLLARRVAVSEAVLESAAPGSEAETLLLCPEMLEGADGLDSEGLEKLRGSLGLEVFPRLVVGDAEDGLRVIVLEEEALAEASTHALEKRQGADLALRDALGESLTLEEADGIFTPQEMARLKLQALTSKDADERIEAIRRFALSPASAQEKAKLYVGVLLDPTSNADVRTEAVRCLERLGLAAEVADSIRVLFSGDKGQTLFAIGRLGMIVQNAAEGERSIIDYVLLELLEETREVEAQEAIMEVFTQGAERLVRNPSNCGRYVRAVLKHFLRSPDKLRNCVRNSLVRLSKQDPEVMAELLWNELNTTHDHDLRTFLMTLTDELLDSPSRADSLAEAIVDEMLVSRAREQERARLRFGLVRLGEAGVRAISRRLPELGNAERPPLIRHLDILCTETEVGREALEDAIRVLVDLLKVGDRATRRTILEARLCTLGGVDSELQVLLAKAMLENVREFKLPDTIDGVRMALEAMGSPAVEPLMEYLETDCDTMQGDLLVETLGEVVVREEGEGRLSAETVRAAIDFCMRFFERAEQTRGGFTQALARMCGYAGAGAERFGPMLEVMTDRLWKAPYSYAMLGALGTAAGSSNCPAGTRVDLCSRFTNILKMEAPKEIGRRRQTDTGTVYEFGREIDFDTVVIPAAVRGLESLCTADGSSDSLRENIIKTLLNLWEGVAKVRVVWSPAAIDALVRAMSRAATCEHVAPRARLVLGSSLLRFAYQKLSVVRALGEVASQRVEDARMARFCLEVGEHLLQEHEKLEARDDERREALLVSMARIAANGSLDAVGRQPEPDAGESDKTFGRRLEELRNRAVQACFRALREGCLFSRAPLEMLGECESLRADLRREIADRINKAFALVRPGRCRPSF